jgi:hypothetical protein
VLDLHCRQAAIRVIEIGLVCDQDIGLAFVEGIGRRGWGSEPFEVHANLVAFSPDELELVVRKAQGGALDALVPFEIRDLAQITVDPAADDDAANGPEALGTGLSAQVVSPPATTLALAAERHSESCT